MYIHTRHDASHDGAWSLTYVNKMATIVAYSFLLALLTLWVPPGQAYPDGGRRICENTSNCAKEQALLKGGLIFVKLDFSGTVEGVLLILDAHLFGDTRIRNVAADFEFTTFTSYLLTTCLMFFTPCSIMKSIVSLSPLRFVITSVFSILYASFEAQSCTLFHACPSFARCLHGKCLMQLLTAVCVCTVNEMHIWDYGSKASPE